MLSFCTWPGVVTAQGGSWAFSHLPNPQQGHYPSVQTWLQQEAQKTELSLATSLRSCCACKQNSDLAYASCI